MRRRPEEKRIEEESGVRSQKSGVKNLSKARRAFFPFLVRSGEEWWTMSGFLHPDS
jgi:hypothetical protein